MYHVDNYGESWKGGIYLLGGVAVDHSRLLRSVCGVTCRSGGRHNSSNGAFCSRAAVSGRVGGGRAGASASAGIALAVAQIKLDLREIGGVDLVTPSFLAPSFLD